MNKKIYIQNLTENLIQDYPFLDINSAYKFVEIIFEQMAHALINNRRIEIRGFGSFSIRESKNKKCRNPNNGEKLILPSHKRVHFKTSLNKVNNNK